MTDSFISEISLRVGSHIFLTNTALVLMMIDRDGEIRMRKIAQAVGITEQAVQRIVDHLITEGYLTVNRAGDRNSYSVNRKRVLGLPFDDCPLGSLLDLCR